MSSFFCSNQKAYSTGYIAWFLTKKNLQGWLQDYFMFYVKAAEQIIG